MSQSTKRLAIVLALVASMVMGTSSVVSANKEGGACKKAGTKNRHQGRHARVHARDLGQEQGKAVLVSNAELRKFGLSEWLIEFQRRHNNNNNKSAPVG